MVNGQKTSGCELRVCWMQVTSAHPTLRILLISRDGDLLCNTRDAETRSMRNCRCTRASYPQYIFSVPRLRPNASCQVHRAAVVQRVARELVGRLVAKRESAGQLTLTNHVPISACRPGSPLLGFKWNATFFQSLAELQGICR
jgi:hypothetical protein